MEEEELALYMYYGALIFGNSSPDPAGLYWLTVPMYGCCTRTTAPSRRPRWGSARSRAALIDCTD
eukprot:947143-Prorocentrum_minimum.AAC.2